MSNPIYDPPEAVRQWRQNRGSAIGSSDIAPILGISPFRTALDVYMEKVAALNGAEVEVDVDDINIDDPKSRGHLFEPAIARAYELRYGVTLEIPPRIVHPEMSFCSATADRKVANHSRLVELKKVNRFAMHLWGEPETDNAPDYYICQTQWQCAMFGIGENDLFALFGDDDFRRYPIQANVAIAKVLFDAAADFWKRVEKRDPPEPDWNHAATYDVVNRLRRPRKEVAISLPDELEPDVQEFMNLKAVVAAGEKAKKEMLRPKAKIVHAMGDAGSASLNGYTFTRKEIEVKGYEVKPRTDVRLTVKSGDQSDE